MLQVNLLGIFQVLYRDNPVIEVDTPRLRPLLAYLVFHAGVRMTRQHLAYLFWPESNERQARTNLRKALFDLRHALPDADHYLEVERATVRWVRDAPYQLDVRDLNDALDAVDGHDSNWEALARAIALYQGELLPGHYEDWIVILREQLHQRMRYTLRVAVDQLEQQRNYRKAIRYTRRLLNLDPLDEEVYRQLMRLHALNGDQTGALYVYRECVETLRREMAAEPDAATQQIYYRIRDRQAAPVASVIEKIEPTRQSIRLVGREQEWRTLLATWRSVLQGNAQFVGILGEAGIGKTRLAEEMVEWADRQGVPTATAWSHPTHDAPAYTPVADILRTLDAGAYLINLEDAWRVEVSRLLPSLMVQRPDLPQPQPLTESWQRLRFFDALTRALPPAERPLLLHFEDMQWCDHETLEWVHFLLSQRKDRPLMVLTTVRNYELGTDHPFHALRRALARTGQMTTLELSPLSKTDTASLVEACNTHDLTATQIEELYAATEGNPLFVVETLRAGGQPEDSGDVERISGLPPKVYAVIQYRLSQLSAQAGEIATLGAVAGSAFTFELLKQISDQNEDTLVDSLDELWRRHIVVDRAGGYDFSHDRIRDVAYAEITETRRRLLHQRVARVLTTIHATDLATVYGQLAAQSAAAGNNVDAVRYYRLAGDQARLLFALREAQGHYQMALTLAQDDHYRDRLLALSARLHLDLQEGDEAVDTFEQLARHARQREDQALLLEALLGLGEAHYTVSLARPATSSAAQKYWDVHEEAYHVARENGDSRGMVLARVGIRHHIMFVPENADQVKRRIDEALILSRRMGDKALELESVLAAIHLWSPADWEREAERLAPEVQGLTGRPQWIELNFLLQIIHALRGNMERSVEYGDLCVDLATISGISRSQCPLSMSIPQVCLGRYEQAVASMQQEMVDDGRFMTDIFRDFVMAFYHLDLLAYDRAGVLLKSVVERTAQLHQPWLQELATVHLGRALALSGRSEPDRLVTLAEELDDLNPTLMARIIGLPAVALGEIALTLECPEEALRQLEAATATAEEEGRRPDVVMARETMARLFLALDRTEEAVNMARSGLTLAQSIGYKPEVWRLQDTLARSLTAQGDDESAAQATATSAAIIQELATAIPDRSDREGFLCAERVSSIMASADYTAGNGRRDAIRT